MTAFDPREMALRGRIGAFVTLARHDARELTKSARAAFRAKFEREVDPDGVLPEAERRRRAEAARQAHYARMRLARSQSRTRKSATPSTTRSGGIGPSPLDAA